MFTEEASGVFGVASRFVDGKNGIVVGERAALAIDCSNYEDEGQAMADFICDKGFAPDRLVLTHGHGDHIGGNGHIKKETGAKICIHELDADMLTNPNLNLSSAMGRDFITPKTDVLLKDKDELKILEQKHTLGKVNFDSIIIADFDESLKSVTTSLLYTDI